MHADELPAPEVLQHRREISQPLGEELSLKDEMLHFIREEFARHESYRGIWHSKIETAKIHLGDEFGREEHLDIELHIHQHTQSAEDGVGPLLLNRSAAEMPE